VSVQDPSRAFAPSGPFLGSSSLEEFEPDRLIAWGRPPILNFLLPHTRCVRDWIAQWTLWTGRSVPDIATARAEFTEVMARETDLSEWQIATIARRIEDDRLAGNSNVEAWIASCTSRFLASVRPWFPLWRAYASWVLQWCEANGYRTIAFLCRDALPFYAVASALTVAREDAPAMRLIHASRKTLDSPALSEHFGNVIRDESPVALLDSGCYGSLVPELLKLCDETCGSPEPAVFFFFSRNPKIFGYMNYLMGWEVLRRPELNLASGLTPADFVIYAGDILEALPKAYSIEALEPDGVPVVAPQDILSFVLGGSVLAALNAFALASAAWGEENDAATVSQTAADLYATFASLETTASGEAPLFDSPAPKDVPAVAHKESCPAGIPPQDEFFGIRAG
jgi:hypothetical protein